MKSTILALTVLACSFNAIAESVTASQSSEQFCADRSSDTFVKDLTGSSSNLFGFRNHGGIANGGVCWWHSRFQRNALYLTYYKPAEEKPTTAGVKDIIERIRDGKSVVEIPGYRNFDEFSSENSGYVQRELEKWQKGDGVIRLAWVKGISGDYSVSPEKMKSLMDELYQYVTVEGNIAYEKLQLKGITAHAWLVVNVKKLDDGYDLQIIDSNYPSTTNVYAYREGQTSFNYDYYGSFVPYLERSNELEKVKESISKFCDK